MNGIITISDGTATMENGNLTDVNTVDANSMNSTILTTTTQPTGTSDNTVATTAFVNNNLLAYALLNPTTPQTFTGSHNFPTQINSTNSTLVATTAYVKNQNYITLSALTPYALLAGPQTFTGNQNFVTQATTDNSTLAATTAYVKGQNYITSSSLTPYALLNPSGNQTFGTGNNIFTNTATFTNGLNSNSNITLFSGTFNSNIKQNTLGLEITNVDTSKYIQLITRTSGGGNVIGVSCANGNSAYLQGDSGAQISITGTQANIGGTSVPTITTQPLSSSNTNEIATTQWSKTQLSGYPTLNGNNVFNGTNLFTNL